MDFLCFAAVAVQLLRDQWSFSSRRTKEIADEYITGNRPHNSHGKHFISSINYIMRLVIHGTDYAHGSLFFFFFSPARNRGYLSIYTHIYILYIFPPFGMN